ncbi:MAG: hypothetical protein ACLQU4_05105 [Limisphaerales bacterium]
MKKIIPALLLFALCGCSTGYNYSPYVGQQENWSTQPGGFVKVVDGATLYAPGQLPNRPYMVIGDVTTHSEDGVAKAVHEQHADAALIYYSRTYQDGSLTLGGAGGGYGRNGGGGGAFSWTTPLTHTDVNARLIKFK